MKALLTGVLAVVLMVSAAFVALAAPEPPGMVPLTIPGGRLLEGYVIYPARPGGPAAIPFGGNAVFRAEQVRPGAMASAGPIPLVILSHGMYGHRFNQLWLARRLAQAGFVAAAVDHPGTTTFNRDRTLSRQLWERPLDIGRVIDALMADSAAARLIDPSRIYAAGHSLGGYTVLAAAGARFDRARPVSFCKTMPEAVACGALQTLGLFDLEVTNAELARDVREPRLAGVVAMDPGGVQALIPESLAGITISVLVVRRRAHSGAPGSGSRGRGRREASAGYIGLCGLARSRSFRLPGSVHQAGAGHPEGRRARRCRGLRTGPDRARCAA